MRARLKRYFDKHAVIETESGQPLDWPRENLPKGTSEGDNLWLIISTSRNLEEEKKKTAKEILNQILNE